MDRAAALGPVTPSQALHLPKDPARAATAESTGQGHELTHVPTPVAQVMPDPAPAAGQRVRAWLRRILGR